MRIVLVGFVGGGGRIGLRSDEADGRIVDASFGFVVVLLDGAFGGLGFHGLLGTVLWSGHENPPEKEACARRR